MTRGWKQALSRCGRRVTVTHGEVTAETWAFIQSAEEKGADAPFSATPLGAADQRRWLYIGDGAQEIAAGDRVRCGEEVFIAQNASAVRLGGETVHYWAYLRPEKEAAL